MGVCDVEAEVLPDRGEDLEAPRALRHAPADDRGELHVPPSAHGEDRGRMARGDTSGLRLRAEGVRAHHAHGPPEASRRDAAALLRARRARRRSPRADPLPDAADAEARRRRARRVHRVAPRRAPLRLEVRHASWYDPAVYDLLA